MPEQCIPAAAPVQEERSIIALNMFTVKHTIVHGRGCAFALCSIQSTVHRSRSPTGPPWRMNLVHKLYWAGAEASGRGALKRSSCFGLTCRRDDMFFLVEHNTFKYDKVIQSLTVVGSSASVHSVVTQDEYK